MTLTLDEIFASPDHFLFAFDGDAALFREMDRAAYHRSIFLDRRIEAKSDMVLRLPVEPLLDLRRAMPSTPKIGWIFHVAHCGSTLLARSLDRADGALVLREPAALRQMAVDGAGQAVDDAWREGLGLVAAMLGRRYPEAGPTIVKANVPVNFVLGEIMALDPTAHGILLHFALDDYLRAILRSPAHRAWINNVTADLRPAIEAEVGPLPETGDAERAAALWLAQMRVYSRALAAWPQLRSLDAERMLADPGPVLNAAGDYFGMLPAADAAALTTRHAKQPHVVFDRADRAKRRTVLTRELAGELAAARKWVENSAATAALPERLTRPLLGEGVSLL